ncbi:hypothetical protein [Aerosakkonema funiforme]|uniref:hypothetical protein n=1 Tax=Aerosakkonema funiforme TaxID=1246630 RepID=UPI0035BBF331
MMGKSFSNKLSLLIRFWATPLATLCLLPYAWPTNPAGAVTRNEFRRCASEMVRAAIPAAVAADACAASLYPEDLTRCVIGINQQTNIAAVDALSTCVTVRRPRDLATCVVNISNRTQNASPPDVLDNCRRSLLPVRFADCVVGLHGEVDISVSQVMRTCIDGSDRPQDFYPSSVAPRRTAPLLDRPIPVPQTPPLGPSNLPILPRNPRGL